MPANKAIRYELLKLAKDYEEEGFTKLASRLTSYSRTFKKAEPIPPPPPPPEEDEETGAKEEELNEESNAINDKDDDEEEEEDGEDPIAEGRDASEEEEEEEDAADDDIEDDASEEEEDDEDEVGAMEEMDEDISMRDACTKIYRAAKKVANHPSPRVRALSKRLLKVERLIRATL